MPKMCTEVKVCHRTILLDNTHLCISNELNPFSLVAESLPKYSFFDCDELKHKSRFYGGT